MKRVQCSCEGLSMADREKYEDMLLIIDNCKEVGISPPFEAIEYVGRYEKGEETSLVKLRPGIDHGVTKKVFGDREAVIINLNEIDNDIDIIRVFLNEFDE